MIYQAGLILEGGGMKGIYTAGVLDFFMDKEIAFSDCYGVSAGACHLCNFMSGQRGRSYRISVNYLDMKQYCGKWSLLTTGDLFGVDMNYNLIPNYLDPYDYDAAAGYEGRAFAVATDIETGKPAYLPLRDLREDLMAVRASSSLPLVSRNVKIGDRVYLDGGISDSIPLLRSVVDGNRKNVVVLTKEKGFVRKPSSQSLLLGLRYLRYPKVAELMSWRHVHYAAQTAYVERMRKSGQVFVIRPKKDIGVGRVEKNLEKLMELYRQGYEDAKGCYGEMMQFLGDVPDQ